MTTMTAQATQVYSVVVGRARPLGLQREHGERDAAADPEHGDADVDQLEDGEPVGRGVGRVEGEDESDGGDGEADRGRDLGGGVARGGRLDVCRFHAAE